MSKNEAYEEYGCANRKEYLKMLARENGVPLRTVLMLADLLGESEDFDGLVCEVEDQSLYLARHGEG